MACPFCREIPPPQPIAQRRADHCPFCEVRLLPLDGLPPPFHFQDDADEHSAIDQELPWWFWGGGRGALLSLCILGFLAFFAPWCAQSAPEIYTWSGYAFAAGPMAWLWGGAVAWFVMFPLVLTRRSIRRLWGVRIICTAFATMTALEVLVLLVLSRPDTESLVPISFEWAWGLYASLVVSGMAIFFALRLGGRAPD